MAVNDGRNLKIECVPLDTLKPDPGNPKQHSARQVGQIARSIETFGFNDPILIDRDGRIIGGHGRALALRLLGRTAVPVIRIEHLSPAQASAYAIAENRLAELAVWDDRLLGERFLELSAVDLDFSLEVTGFTMGEIDLRIEQAAPGSIPPGADPADDLPNLADEPAVSQPGDLWCAGRHRILCADALDGSVYRQLMDRSKAQAVFTDPPYNLPIGGYVSGKGRVGHREFPMASGEMDRGQFTRFLRTAVGQLIRHSVDGSMHFICIDWRHQGELLAAADGVYSELKNLCVWVKDNAGMGSLYRSQHELILVFKNGTRPHRNNVQLGQFGRNRTNVWQYPSIHHFGRRGEEGDLLARHPTPKPVALVADALLDCSARGALVLDPFLGSGSTLIAAERVGRSCRGIELDPVYVDLAIRRWQRFTGAHAVHAPSGKRFDDLAREGETVND
jgi:DNA modification methylase